MTSDKEIYLSYLWDQILVACNRIHKKLDKYDEFLSSYTTPVISYHEQPSWHVATDVVQPRPPPDPPNGQPELYRHQFNPYPVAQPPYHPYKPPPLPNTLPQSNPSSCWYPSHQREQHGYYHYDNRYPSLPPEPMSELYQHYPSPTPAPDDLYYHYQPMGELYPPVYNGDGDSSNSYNYSMDEYLPYTDFWQPEDHTTRSLPQSDQPPHPPPGLPSCGSPTAAAVWQPPQLRSPYSWADMPPQHIQYSGPAYAATTIAPTTTTQGRSCQEYPVDVQQPLLRPTSHHCSKLTPLAVTAVLIPPPPPLTPGSSTAQLLAAAPPPPSPAIFLPCSPDRIHTLSIILAAAAPSQVDDSRQPSLLHLPCSMKEYKPKTWEVQVHKSDGVNIHYKGMLTDGTIFNPTFERGDPIDIELGWGQVMKRWLLVLGMLIRYLNVWRRPQVRSQQRRRLRRRGWSLRPSRRRSLNGMRSSRIATANTLLSR